MTDKELNIYFAGLIDGEGSINITQYKTQFKKNIRWRPSIKITMTDREPLEIFGKKFGFRVYEYKNKTKGGRKIYSCDAAWHGCQRILEVIEPYLIVKKELACLVLDFCRHVRKYKRELRLAPRNKNGTLKAGKQISYKEAKYRYDIYCKVKKLVQTKSISSHRKRLSEEVLQELILLDEMRKSELQRK